MKTASTPRWTRSFLRGRITFACAVLGCIVLNCLRPPLVAAQDYTKSTGMPDFTTRYPAEMGWVDASSGNLHLEIPIASFPQRGLANIDLKLTYDSHIWTSAVNEVSGAWTPNNVWGHGLTGGWNFTIPGMKLIGQSNSYCHSACSHDVAFIDPNASYHWITIWDDGSGSTNFDTSGLRLAYTSSGTSIELFDHDGTVEYNNLDPAISDVPQDTNGNYLHEYYVPIGTTSYLATAVTDTLGRSPYSYGTTAGCIYTSSHSFASFNTCYDIPTSKGTTSRYQLTLVDIPLKTNFQRAGTAECTTNCWVTVLSAISLPDGTSYGFLYDCDSATGNSACNSSGQAAYYGTLTKLTLPTGQSISYSYTTFGGVSQGPNSNQAPSRWLTTKTSSGATWTYTPVIMANWGPSNTCLPNFQVGCLRTTVTRPDGSKEIASFIVDPFGGSWPQTIQSFDTNGATLLSTVTNTWTFGDTCILVTCRQASASYGYSVGYSNVGIVSSLTTMPVPNGNVTTKTEYTWESGTPQSGNIASMKQWNYRSGSATTATFPAVPERAVYLTYSHLGPHNATTRIATKTICNNSSGTDPNCPGGGQTAGRTLLSYDGYGSGGSLALAVPPAGSTQNHEDTNRGTAYKTRGNPTEVSRWISGNTYLIPTAVSSYDTTGQVVQILDSLSHATTLSYVDNFVDDSGADPPAAHGALPKATNAYVTSTTDAIGSRSMAYYLASGKAAIATDYNGASTYSHFVDASNNADPLDRPTRTSYPIGWRLNTYSSASQFDSYVGVGTATASTSCSQCKHFQNIMDSLGRISSVSLVNNPAGTVSMTTTYDALNRDTSASHPNFGSGDPNNVLEFTTYDGLGRVLSVTHPDNQKLSRYYGSSVVAAGGLGSQQGSPATYGYAYPILTKDESGTLQQQWTNAFGDIVEVDESGLPATRITNFTHDTLGNLTSVIQGQQNRTFQYDGLGRLTRENTPEASTTTNGNTVQNTTMWSYLTTSGSLCSGSPLNPCSKTDARGYVTNYTYDAANRLTGRTHIPNTTGPVTYSYGANAANHNIGRITKMTDPSGSETYSYDAMGRVTIVTKVISGTSYKIQYSYNVAGQLKKLTYPSGRAVYLTYDGVGNLCIVASAVNNTCGTGSSPYLAILSSDYDAAGRPLVATYGNGVVATAAYDPQRSQLATLSYSKGVSKLFSLNYYYKADSTFCPGGSTGNNGQIQCINDVSSGAGSGGRNVRFTYDRIGRLGSATTSGSTQYPAWGVSEEYDLYGNRTAQNVTAGSAYPSSITVSPVTNQITSPALSYDSGGRVIAEPAPLAATYSYDVESCLTSYSGNGSAATYTCDGSNTRVKKAVTGTGAVTTVYIYSGGRVIAEYDNGAAVTAPNREYIYGLGRIATIVGSTGGTGGTTTYEHRDHLSPRLFTNSSGAIVGQQGHYPFGELWYSSGQNSAWIFTTYERDAESGVGNGHDYAMMRSYSSGVGRFLSPDPLKGSVDVPQSWNPYLYSLDDPVNNSDPSGQESCDFANVCSGSGPYAGSHFDIAWYGNQLVNALWVPDGTWVGDYSGFVISNEWVACGGLGCGVGSDSFSGASSSNTTFESSFGINFSGVDALQFGLAGVGFIPGPVGQVANGTNAVISLYRGRYWEAAGYGTAALMPVAGGMLADAGKAAQVAKAAEEAALAARDLGAERGAAAALQVGDEMITDLSSGARLQVGGTPTPIHPEVQELLDAVPENMRSPYHGNCAEIGCLSKALSAGKNVEGSQIAVSSVKKGVAMAPCTSCQSVLTQKGVRSVLF